MGATLWSAARLACAGAAAGLAGTRLLAALIGNALYSVPGSHRGLLYGVTTTEPLILASAVAGLLVTAVTAAAVPARRVVRIDPVEALRAE
jgi:ABC-type antimicrobial peptide transport system permease subunit